MVLLVTRPEPQASTWAERLRQAGLAARALPLIAITAPSRPHEVTRLWQELGAHRALMFVSPAAVEGFFRLRPLGSGWPSTTLATAPGPGTAHALLEAGRAAGLQGAQIVTPDAEAEQFDSEALWPLLEPLDWRGGRVAIVSGGDASGAQGRTWLTERWQAAGAHVHAVQAYARGPGEWTAEQAALARDSLQRLDTVWLLSSSQALDFLLDHHLPRLGAEAWQAERAAGLHLLCTHPRIAEHASRRGILHAERCAPTLASVAQARRPSTD